jgi:DNA (cytosine-5)-methyltransferase 1
LAAHRGSAALSRPTAIDLFSGCGGLTLGLRRAGFDVLAAVDVDPLATRSYRENHPDTVMVEEDIKSVRAAVLLQRAGLQKRRLDLVAGCPPCQGFSSLRTFNGARRVNEPMNDLVFEFVRIVEELNPRAVMLENVPGLFDDERLVAVESRLADLGYNCSSSIFDAAEYGVPQRRRRMILLGAQEFEPKFGRRLYKPMTVRAALCGLDPPSKSADPLHNYKVRRAPHVSDLIKKIPKNGGSRSSLPDEEQLACHQACAGFHDIYGRMSWDEPSPTITGGCINPSKGRFLHPQQNRAITLREAALLQGFPESYRFSMERGRYPAAQMIGNAFPPALAERHARALLGEMTKKRRAYRRK